MDFIKTKCKQRIVNHIAKYNTRQRSTGQKRGKKQKRRANNSEDVSFYWLLFCHVMFLY